MGRKVTPPHSRTPEYSRHLKVPKGPVRGEIFLVFLLMFPFLWMAETLTRDSWARMGNMTSLFAFTSK